MDDLLAARLQMASSLAFHIIFAGLGIGLPLLMVLAEGLWLRTGNVAYLALARRWAKAFAILFAVGAVSGTILSFELGLLWPRFMEFAGGIIGMPFSAEGFAFFIEAIFLGLYLYGWDRLSPARPLADRHPGRHQRPALRHLRGLRQCLDEQSRRVPHRRWAGGRRRSDRGHVQRRLASAVAAHVARRLPSPPASRWPGVYAWGVLRGRNDAYHRAGLTVALSIAALFALLQPISGDISARWVAENQPVKFAALEGQFQTERHAGLQHRRHRRILARGRPLRARDPRSAQLPGPRQYRMPRCKGLDEWPLADQPDPRIVHVAFQIMVGIGFSVVALCAWFWLAAWRRTADRAGTFRPWLLRALVLATPLGFIAIEAGWTVTEVGRQPWIIQGVMRTEEAVTPVPDQFVALRRLHPRLHHSGDRAGLAPLRLSAHSCRAGVADSPAAHVDEEVRHAVA